jgi:hypothetical protein
VTPARGAPPPPRRERGKHTPGGYLFTLYTRGTSIAGGAGVHKDAEGEGCITLDGDRVHLDLRVED